MGPIPIVGSNYTLAIEDEIYFLLQSQAGKVQAPVCISLDGYPSGQRGLTVNQLAGAFGGSNPSPSIAWLKLPGSPAALIAQSVERVLGKNEVMGSNPIEGFLPN